MYLDRVVCSKSKPDGKLQSIYCNIKNIDRNNNIKFDFHGNLTSLMDDAWFHIVVYHKFNGILYNKFPIDLWENLCEYLNKKREKAFGLNWLLSKLLKYTNLLHPCPYEGLIFIKADNVSLSEIFPFDYSFLPAGAFRIDMAFTDGNRVPFIESKIYGGVSDHRIEVI